MHAALPVRAHHRTAANGPVEESCRPAPPLNYVREEIQQEALVRNLAPFARFLEVAALVNAQAVNVAGIARDAAEARPTVQGYFAEIRVRARRGAREAVR